MTQEVLKKRIKTTNDLYGIVTTMKLLSSVSVGQYEKALVSLNQYTQTISLAFQGLFHQEFFSLPNTSNPQKSGKTLVIVIGSDNGLVGRFNWELVQEVKKESPLTSMKLITIGKRLSTSFFSKGLKPDFSYSNSNTLSEISSLADTILTKVNQLISADSFEKVLLFYNKKENNSFQPQKLQLLPFSEEILKQLKETPWSGRMLPLINPENETLFSALSQEYLIVFLVQALTSSLACEHYIRMLHMQQAEKNIEKKLAQLDLIYQQERQNQITNELIDIVSGAQAMNSSLDKCPKKQ